MIKARGRFWAEVGEQFKLHTLADRVAAMIASLAGIAHSQINSEAAIEIACEYAGRSGMAFDRTKANVGGLEGPGIVCESGGVSTYIRPNGRIQTVHSQIRADSARSWDGSGEVLLRTEADLRVRASEFIPGLGLSFANLRESEVEMVEPDKWSGASPDSRSSATIVFYENPNGYKAIDRNFASLTFDRRNGQVITWIYSNDNRFATPRIRLTAEQAAERVRAVLPDERMITEEIIRLASDTRKLAEGAQLVYSRPNGDFGSQNFTPHQIKPLSYHFAFKNLYVLIDAETGECRGGGIWKEARTQTPTAKVDNRPLVYSGIGTLLLLSGLIALRFFRR